MQESERGYDRKKELRTLRQDYSLRKVLPSPCHFVGKLDALGIDRICVHVCLHSILRVTSVLGAAVPRFLATN